MPREIDEQQVRHIAKLSRLKLSAHEIREFSKQLGEIVEYFHCIDQVDTEGVEPLAHPLPLTNVLRDDEPGEPYDTERAMKNAPQREGSFFRVPKVLDQGA